MGLKIFALGTILGIGAGYLTGWGGMRVSRSTTDDTAEFTARFRRLMVTWGAVVTVALVAFSVVAGLPTATQTALPHSVPDWIGLTVGWLLVVPATILCITTAYYAAFPPLNEVRRSDAGRYGATVAFARTMTVWLTFLGFPAAIAATAFDTGFGAVAIGVGVASIPLLAYLFGPILVSRSVSARAPTESERSRLDSVTATVDLPEMDYHVVEGAFEADSEVAIVGPPWSRHLYVSASVFDSPDAFESALAIQSGKEHVSYRLISAAFLSVKMLVGISIIIYLLKLLPIEPSPLGLVVALTGGVSIVLALDWFCWKLVYRSDEHAASHVGTDELAETLHHLAEVGDIVENPSRIVQHARMTPSVSRRRSRLTERQ